MLKKLEQSLFPYVCCLCGMYSDLSQDLCSVCKASLPWMEQGCYQCGLPLDFGRDSICCQSCVGSPPEFDRLCSVFHYQFPVVKLITTLKFGENLSHGRILGELLSERILKKWYQSSTLPQAVLPVPLHLTRLRKRGFNQALELILPLIKQYPLPLLIDNCTRIRNTPPQSTLGKEERSENLKGAFQLIKPIQYEHIVIIDDVVTTGSTVNALSKLLKERGVARIDVWCICRAGS